MLSQDIHSVATNLEGLDLSDPKQAVIHITAAIVNLHDLAMRTRALEVATPVRAESCKGLVLECIPIRHLAHDVVAGRRREVTWGDVTALSTYVVAHEAHEHRVSTKKKGTVRHG